MTTAQDLITGAYQRARIYSPVETPSAAALALGLTLLNDMLDLWSNESLMCFANQEQSGALQVGVSQYTLGPGGTFATTRPIKVSTGPGAAYLQDTLGNNYPVDVLEQDTWNLIGNRTTTSQIPDTIFIDPQFPQAVLNVFPTPTMTYTLFIDSRLPLTDFATLQTAANLPPGYSAGIKSSLACELWGHYKDPTKIPPWLVQEAARFRANLKRTNLREVVASYDGEIVGRASGTYNIYRDGRGSSS